MGRRQRRPTPNPLPRGSIPNGVARPLRQCSPTWTGCPAPTSSRCEMPAVRTGAPVSAVTTFATFVALRRLCLQRRRVYTPKFTTTCNRPDCESRLVSEIGHYQAGHDPNGDEKPDAV